MQREVRTKVKGYRTQDGAGVSLVRVLGNSTANEFDPILMLDSFDSTNPSDYIAGFPMHPHRGIETVSYVYKGNMLHRDSLGHQDAISDGEVQWMTAGSGIMHEEKLPASKRMLGVQLWLNLPAKYKMVPPAYKSIKNANIQEIDLDNGKLRLLAGKYKDNQGHTSSYLPLDFYDIHLNANSQFEIEVGADKSILLFTFIGDIKIGKDIIEEKTAVKLTQGNKIIIESLDNNAQVLFVSSDFLREPIVWGGPIVMNTKEELQRAFDELRQGTFIQKEIEY